MEPTGKQSRRYSSEPRRTVGWLRVCSEDPEVGRWEKRFCALAEDVGRLHFFKDADSALTTPSLRPMLVGDHEGRFRDDITFDTTGCFQPAALKSSAAAGGGGGLSFSRSSRRFGSKMKRSIRRSKSLTRKSPGEIHPNRRSMVETTNVNKEIDRHELKRRSLVTQRSFHRSLDSLDTVGIGDPDSWINLSHDPAPHIALLHPSVSPADFCFFISYKERILYFSAQSQDDMEIWMERISQQIEQHTTRKQHKETHEFCLRLTDGKGLKDGGKTKCSYYCDVLVDGNIYARTASRVFQDVVYWGDDFTISDYPHMSSVSIMMYKDGNAPLPRRRSESGMVHQSVLVGKVELPVAEKSDGLEKEAWAPVDQSNGVSVRIKTSYQHVTVLLLEEYREMIQCVVSEPRTICETFEPLMDTRSKEQLAYSTLRILSGADLATAFIVDLVIDEVKALESDSMIFRGNTFASKLMDCHMRITASEYLKKTLKDTISYVFDYELDCEVDPVKLPANISPTQLANNQGQFIILVEKVWCRLFSSIVEFPPELRRTLHELRKHISSRDVSIARRLVTGSVFLRFICPAILSPRTFQLSHATPDDRVSRRLKLVGKVLQTLASLGKFGNRESFLAFCNDFISKERANMELFIDRISDSGRHCLQPNDLVQLVAEQRDEGNQLPRLPLPATIDLLPSAPPTILRDLACLHHLVQKHIGRLQSDAPKTDVMLALARAVQVLTDKTMQSPPPTPKGARTTRRLRSSAGSLEPAGRESVPRGDDSGHNRRRQSRDRMPYQRPACDEEPSHNALISKSLMVPSSARQHPLYTDSFSSTSSDGDIASLPSPSSLGATSPLSDLHDSVMAWHQKNMNVSQRKPSASSQRNTELQMEVSFLKQQLADATTLLRHSCACLGLLPCSWDSQQQGSAASSAFERSRSAPMAAKSKTSSSSSLNSKSGNALPRPAQTASGDVFQTGASNNVTLLEMAGASRTRLMSMDSLYEVAAPGRSQSQSSQASSAASSDPAQTAALHQANARFANSLEKHFKETADFQCIDELLHLNASLAASGRSQSQQQQQQQHGSK